MTKLTEQVSNFISENQCKDRKKLDKQVKYYNNLKKKGIVKQQNYSLKPISAI